MKYSSITLFYALGVDLSIMRKLSNHLFLFVSVCPVHLRTLAVLIF